MYTTFLLYYPSSKFSKFIQSKSPLLQQMATVSLLKEKSKIYPKLIELLSWNDPTVQVYCFMLARASTKTFVCRVQKTAGKKLRQLKNSLAGSLVNRGITVQSTLTINHFHLVWIRKTNQMSLFVFFISLLIVAQHVSGNHVPIIRS